MNHKRNEHEEESDDWSDLIGVAGTNGDDDWSDLKNENLIDVLESESLGQHMFHDNKSGPEEKRTSSPVQQPIQKEKTVIIKKKIVKKTSETSAKDLPTPSEDDIITIEGIDHYTANMLKEMGYHTIEALQHLDSGEINKIKVMIIERARQIFSALNSYFPDEKRIIKDMHAADKAKKTVVVKKKIIPLKQIHTDNVIFKKDMNDFTKIDGIDDFIANNLEDMGYNTIEDLKDLDPNELKVIRGMTKERAIRIFRSLDDFLQEIEMRNKTKESKKRDTSPHQRQQPNKKIRFISKKKIKLKKPKSTNLVKPNKVEPKTIKKDMKDNEFLQPLKKRLMNGEVSLEEYREIKKELMIQ